MTSTTPYATGSEESNRSDTGCRSLTARWFFPGVSFACLAAAVALAGCGSEAWWGDGLDERSSSSGEGVKATVETPDGIQTDNIAIDYALEGEVPAADVRVSYSLDGEKFLAASEAETDDSEGTTDLAVNPVGSPHVFVWDSAKDLGGRRESSVIVEVAPTGGAPGRTGPMVLHNAVFLAGVENSGPGRVRLYSLDPSTAKIESLMVADTGGRDPFDILFLEGHFLVAHAASNDVAVLRLDEAARRLEPVEGSPFRTGGTGARFLATDGARVFVANTTEGTLSVFDFDPESGSLELRRDRRTSVPGCRSLLVKSGRLYVASETRGQIVIFDIAGDGSLAVNEASPVEAEGLNSPSTLVACGKYLYAANARSSPLCAFTFAPDGGLEPLPGSPFNLSRSGVTDMAVVGTSPRRLFAVTGADSTLIAMTISASGALREEDGSPFDLDGPAQAVEGAGTFLLVPGSRLPAMKAWDLQAAATLSATGVKALATEAALVRTAVTD